MKLAIWPGGKDPDRRNYGLIKGGVQLRQNFESQLVLSVENLRSLRNLIRNIAGVDWVEGTALYGTHGQLMVRKSSSSSWADIEPEIISVFQRLFSEIDGIIYPEFTPYGWLTGYGTAKPPQF